MEPPGGVAWLLVLNSHGIPMLSRAHGMDSPPLVLQGLVNGLFSAALEAQATIGTIASQVRRPAWRCLAVAGARAASASFVFRIC
jgi:hypothetical protein